MTLHRRSFLRLSLAASCASLPSTLALAQAADVKPLRVMFYGGPISSVQADLEKKVKLMVFRAGQDPKKNQSVMEDNVIGLATTWKRADRSSATARRVISFKISSRSISSCGAPSMATIT